jgi:hypothetical protein
LQDTFQEHKHALCREGFLMNDETIYEQWKNDEEYHTPNIEEDLDETSMSIVSLDKDEFFHPCFPPAHEVEEEISPNDE